jgi:hypothetical protein
MIMFYNVLWGFSIDPTYFGYNSAGLENHVLHIFKFQRPSQTPIDRGFFGALIFYHEKHQEKKSMRRGPGAKRAHVARPPGQAAPPKVVQASSLQHRQSSSPDGQLDLKTSIYIYPPWTITIGGGGETRNIETEAVPAKIEGNAAGVAPGWFFTLSHVNIIITTMKRE